MWQRLMIALATSPRAKRIAQGNRRLASLARRFVGGPDLDSAVLAAQALQRDGLSASFNAIGEYLDDPVLIDRSVATTAEIPERVKANGIDCHISIDPTAVGLSHGEDVARDNLGRLGEAVKAVAGPPPASDLVMLDMEDREVVEPTLRLCRHLLDHGVPTAITLQAYLRRTASDIPPLLGRIAAIRLVKGAFVAPAAVAFQGRAEVDRNYQALARQMLSEPARDGGLYPVFGTHDEAMIGPILEEAQRRGWAPGSFEFEMLYGVRPDLQRRLRDQGHGVRLYLPFGTDWFPYVVRRVGENPRNLLFALRAATS